MIARIVNAAPCHLLFLIFRNVSVSQRTQTSKITRGVLSVSLSSLSLPSVSSFSSFSTLSLFSSFFSFLALWVSQWIPYWAVWQIEIRKFGRMADPPTTPLIWEFFWGDFGSIMLWGTKALWLRRPPRPPPPYVDWAMLEKFPNNPVIFLMLLLFTSLHSLPLQLQLDEPWQDRTINLFFLHLSWLPPIHIDQPEENRTLSQTLLFKKSTFKRTILRQTSYLSFLLHTKGRKYWQQRFHHKTL